MGCGNGVRRWLNRPSTVARAAPMNGRATADALTIDCLGPEHLAGDETIPDPRAQISRRQTTGELPGNRLAT